MDEAERCDRLLLMREGRIIADGTPAGSRERTGAADIEQAFLALVESEARHEHAPSNPAVDRSPSPAAC